MKLETLSISNSLFYDCTNRSSGLDGRLTADACCGKNQTQDNDVFNTQIIVLSLTLTLQPFFIYLFPCEIGEFNKTSTGTNTKSYSGHLYSVKNKEKQINHSSKTNTAAGACCTHYKHFCFRNKYCLILPLANRKYLFDGKYFRKTLLV